MDPGSLCYARFAIHRLFGQCSKTFLAISGVHNFGSVNDRPLPTFFVAVWRDTILDVTRGAFRVANLSFL